MEATAWIALGALLFAGTQAWIAYRKLRLDLFTKRYETWEALNDAINERREKQPLDPSVPYEGDDPALIRVWRLQRSMRVLFPVDVSECLERVHKAMMARDIAHMEATAVLRDTGWVDQADMTAKLADLRAADQEWFDAQDELGRLVHGYVRQYGWIELASVHIRRRAKHMLQAVRDRLRRPAG